MYLNFHEIHKTNSSLALCLKKSMISNKYFFSSISVSCIWTKTIYLSLDGNDSLTCGSSITKCKSINHALEINSHMTHLQLILESHPLKHLTYMIERSHPLGKLTFLSIKSHKSLNKNPIIYAGEINGAFIQIEDNRQIELEINFVNLENFQLFPSKNQPLTINLILKMSNSTIRNHELTIGSFINNLFYWATTVSEVRDIYKSIIQRDEASFNLYLQKHFLFEIAKQVIRGVYNSFHESREYSGRIGHFLDLFPSRVTIYDVKTIYDDILQNNIQKARDIAKISEQKFDLLVEYIKADIKTITFLNVNLASGSRVAFRNCSVKYGGRIHIRMLKEEEGTSTFVLEIALLQVQSI